MYFTYVRLYPILVAVDQPLIFALKPSWEVIFCQSDSSFKSLDVLETRLTRSTPASHILVEAYSTILLYIKSITTLYICSYMHPPPSPVPRWERSRFEHGVSGSFP